MTHLKLIWVEDGNQLNPDEQAANSHHIDASSSGRQSNSNREKAEKTKLRWASMECKYFLKFYFFVILFLFGPGPCVRNFVPPHINI